MPSFADPLFDISSRRKAEACDILQASGLQNVLLEVGQVYLLGSVYMNLMVAPDIDLYVQNRCMSLEKLYVITQTVFKLFRPTWFEAKEEVTEEGRTVWFLGFCAQIDQVLWNFDIWFFDQPTIDKAMAFCDTVRHRAHTDPQIRDAILSIKSDLVDRYLYRFDRYHSMDVYTAVLDEGIRTTEEFLARHREHIE